MTATLTISGMTGSYDMTINQTDGSATATINNVPAGTQTFTITFYNSSGLIKLAQASTTGSVVAGQTTTIDVLQSQIDTSFDDDNDGYTNLDEVEAGSDPTDPNSFPQAPNTWITKAYMPTARFVLGIGVINGILYAVGGENINLSAVSVLEAYSPTTNTWTTKASMPTARDALAVGVVNNILYAVGGRNDTGVVSTVEAYDP
ncbi:MAG: hypothetical protein HZA13_08665 [Nitrospirae bacterium]|nr:hypothetical protein [Nitrospirota bacterium]